MAVYNKDGTRIDSGGGGSSSVFIPDVSPSWYDKICKSINHRGWTGGGAVENSLAAFKASKTNGYYYVETDVRYTSDGYAVLYHDDYIDGTAVSTMTYAQMLAAVPTLAKFEDFIKLCRDVGLHPYIEFKGTFTQEQVNALIATVQANQMQHKVTWFGGSANVGRVRNTDPNARLGILSNTITSTDISNAQALLTGTNEVFLDTWVDRATSEVLTAVKASGLPLELYSFTNSTSEIINMDRYITGFTSGSLIAGKVLQDAAMV